jgi:tetratricopeptide (TPR) repeat protein
MVLQHKRVANAVRVREMVDAAFAARYQDLEAMLTISSRAVALAEEKIHELPTDLVVAAWTQYGNALRIAGDFEKAEKALGRASALPVSDLPTKIHLLEVTASLHRNTDRFESAVHFLTVAAEAYRSIGDSLGEARTYNLLGLVCFDWKDWQRALSAYQTALNLLGPDSPIDVVATTGHNLVETLIADRRLGAAAAALAILEPFFRRFPPGSLTAKTEWLRARLCRGLGQLSAARLAYDRAYALLSTEPRSPDLTELIREMAEFANLPQPA